MKLDKPLMMAEQSRLLPRIVRAVLIGVAVVVAIMLLVAPKPWEIELSKPEWNLKKCVRFSLWWAGLLALPVLSILALTVRRWTAPVPELWHICLKNRMPRLFWPIVGVITILYAATAAPRLRQSLWDDEVYTVRKIVLGTDRIQSDGSAKIKQLPWSHTLWHCEGARNHGLQSILCRLSLGVIALTACSSARRPSGCQALSPALCPSQRWHSWSRGWDFHGLASLPPRCSHFIHGT